MLNFIPRTIQRKLSSALKLLLVIGAIAGLALAAMRLPEPIVDAMLEKDLRQAAQVWKSRILQQLDAGAKSFEWDVLSERDRVFLNNIPKTSDVHRVTLIDYEGSILFSTLKRLNGTVHNASVDHAEILEGESFYQIKMLRPNEVEGLELQTSGTDHFTIREVAIIDLPVFNNGKFVGNFEFQRDITVLRETFILRMQILIGVMATLCAAALLFGFRLVMRVNKKQLQLMEEKAEHDRNLMTEQIRMARDVRVLGELNEWLQSSRSLEELFEMVSKFMSHLFPGVEGSIYVYSNSRDVLDGCASWNGGEYKEHIYPEECWGLRRGRTYAYGETEIDFTCAHSEPHDGRPYLCFPILAHGETVGLMHLRARPETSKEEFNESRKLAQTSAEQISLAIANVQMRDQLQEQSVRDPLTGLFNRRHLTESLRKSIANMGKTGEPVSIVSIDVDHFKKFNDNHGHDAGDMVLRAVGVAMEQSCNGDEVACRMGGEEFMMLLPSADVEAAMEKAEKLRRSIEKVSVRYGEKTLPRITISVGVATAPEHGSMPQDLIRIADDALYKAKAAGRNQVVLASFDCEDETVAELSPTSKSAKTKRSKETSGNGEVCKLVSAIEESKGKSRRKSKNELEMQTA